MHLIQVIPQTYALARDVGLRACHIRSHVWRPSSQSHFELEPCPYINISTITRTTQRSLTLSSLVGASLDSSHSRLQEHIDSTYSQLVVGPSEV